MAEESENVSSFAKESSREAILKRLRLLKTLVDHLNTPEPERLAALGRMKVLRDRYNFSESDIEDDEEDFSNQTHETITLTRFHINGWIRLLISSLAGIYDCVALHQEMDHSDYPGYKMSNKVHIVGDVMDVECAVQLIDFVYPQMIAQSDAFYSQVKHILTPTMENLVERLQAEAAIQNGFFFSARPDMVNRFMIRQSLAHFVGNMPDQYSPPWAEVEQDWGIGLATILYNRVTDSFKEAQTQNDEKDEEQAIAGQISGEVPKNQLVMVSRSLVEIEQIKEKKQTNAMDYAREITGGNFKDASVEEQHQYKHEFAYRRGLDDGQQVGFEKRERTTAKKHKDAKGKNK